MKRILALLLVCALMLGALCGCQPTAESLLRQGILAQAFDQEALQAMVEDAILSGQDAVSVNYLGRQRALEQSLPAALNALQAGESYLVSRFLAGYSIAYQQERGYVVTVLSLEFQDTALLADMPRQDGGALSIETYSAEGLEALLLHLFADKTERALRCYEAADMDWLNETLRQDLESIQDQNYAYAYFVESAEWTLRQYGAAEGTALVELDLQLTYVEDSLPLSQIPVANTPVEMIRILVESWAAGEEKATLIMEGLTPDEDELFAWINTAEVNSATLACEGDSIWYEILENPSERTIGRFWLEFGASEGLRTQAQEELALAIQQISNELKIQTAGMGAEEAYRAVFDCILEMTEYDDEIREATEEEALTEEMQILRSAYGSLVAGRTVCTGYTRGFQALCDALGLPCWSINGYQQGEGHAWNLVYLNGEALYVDCTFGDTGGNPGRYFLVDQQTMDARDYVLDDGFVLPW